jgi:hypothetical protein
MQHREAQRKRKEAMAIHKRLEEADRDGILNEEETEMDDDETNYYDDDDGGSGKSTGERQIIFRNNSNRKNDINVKLHQIAAQDEGVLYTHTITVSRVGITVLVSIVALYFLLNIILSKYPRNESD